MQLQQCYYCTTNSVEASRKYQNKSLKVRPCASVVKFSLDFFVANAFAFAPAAENAMPERLLCPRAHMHASHTQRVTAEHKTQNCTAAVPLTNNDKWMQYAKSQRVAFGCKTGIKIGSRHYYRTLPLACYPAEVS